MRNVARATAHPTFCIIGVGIEGNGNEPTMRRTVSVPSICAGGQPKWANPSGADHIRATDDSCRDSRLEACMRSELDMASGVARVPPELLRSLSPDRLTRVMPLRILLSKAACRTSDPSISHLMQTALENPGIISLAAGFVDQQSLPVEISARSVSTMFAEGEEGAGLFSTVRRWVIPVCVPG